MQCILFLSEGECDCERSGPACDLFSRTVWGADHHLVLLEVIFGNILQALLSTTFLQILPELVVIPL